MNFTSMKGPLKLQTGHSNRSFVEVKVRSLNKANLKLSRWVRAMRLSLVTAVTRFAGRIRPETGGVCGISITEILFVSGSLTRQLCEGDEAGRDGS
jgi:hypothetical protein